MFPAACLIAWLTGIFLSGYLGSNILVFILPVFLTVLGICWNWMMSRFQKQKNNEKEKQKNAVSKLFIKPLILLGIALISIGWYRGYEAVNYQKAIALCRENPSSLTGVVTSEVHRYNDTDYCTVTLENGQHISVKIRTESSLFPGEKVTLQEPALAVIHPENRQSSQVRRMLGNDTFLSATFPYEPNITRHGIQNGWLYHSKLLRNHAKAHFEEYYEPKTAALLTALVSSDKSLMPDDLYQEFIDTGTVHIVVVSGMHFQYLAGAMLFGLSLVCQGRRRRLFITLPLLAVFAWFTGGTLPVLRSFLMTSLLFCYDIFYLKPLKPYLTVLFLGGLFTVITPTLIFNPSFLLTFGATLGITAFYQPLCKAFCKIPSRYIRNSLSMYIAVQPFTLPVILLYFSRFPLGAVIANFLVAPLVAPILIMAVLGMAVMKLPLLGPLWNWMTAFLSQCFLTVIHYAASICHPLNIPLKELPFLLWSGGGMFLFFACHTAKKHQKLAAGLCCALFCMIAMTNTLFPIPDNQPSITFFGAKNTNSAAIKTPSDRLILYGNLQDIAYAKGSSYDSSSVALMILTELSDEEKTELLLRELPQAPIVCPAKWKEGFPSGYSVLFTEENLTTVAEGITIRLLGDQNSFYEAEFSYGSTSFSFTQDAGYFLRNSHKNPDKIWIINFSRTSAAAEKIGQISTPLRILSKKEWHPDAHLYDNYSVIIFRQQGLTLYGKKEQQPLWN